MDFGTLLTVAQKNGTSKQSIACYQTKFAPPKKQSKQTKTLSENIKKFLARKEEEEKLKALEEKRKRENLLALRDHKAQSRINKHLKVCKAANKSVLADAIDNENTAVTMAGPSQPDEDDYGYVSQEASAFYNQLMNKYSNVPPEKPIFSNTGKKTIKDIASTKDRVKQALKQQEVEESLGHRRKRKSTTKDTEIDSQPEEIIEKDSDKKDRDDKPKAKKKLIPPPIDFGELLKIAEKKQHEPIVIEVKAKTDEPERLMTKKQRKEYAKEKEWRERKEQREKLGEQSKTSIGSGKPSKPIGKIPKIEKPSTPPVSTKTFSKTPTSTISTTTSIPTPVKKIVDRSNGNRSTSSKPSTSRSSEKDHILEERKKLEAERKKLEEMRQAIEEEKKKLALSKSKHEDTKTVKIVDKVSKKPVLEKQQVPKDGKQKPVPTAVGVKPKVSSIPNGKPKQFPPPDLKPLKSQLFKNARRPQILNKRRIYDDDEEDHDSELDDFIDDEVEEHSEDYSKYISEIFGYDKSKYRNIDEDDTAMESSFAQQLKEEYVSTKIGIMEDLEDIRMEALEKKRKALLKKKIKK